MRIRNVHHFAVAAIVPFALCAGATITLAPAADGDSVPLPGGSCALPETIRGATGHVLFRYMLRSGNEAKQIKPVFVRVEPDTHREAFLAATQACIARQATKGRGPDPRTDVRYMAFHFVSPAPAGAPRARLAPGRSLPAAWVDEVRAQKLILAREILAEPVLIEHALPGVRLLSNAGSTAVREIVEGLEFVIRAFDQTFPEARPAPADSELTVLVFRDADGLEQMAAFDNLAGGVEPRLSHYQLRERIVYLAAPHDRPYRLMAGVVIRDLARHLVTLRLAPEGKELPYWVTDGLSAFFQCLNWTRGKSIDLAAVERQWEVRGMFKYRQPGGVMLEALGRLSASGELPSFLELPIESPRTPWDPNALNLDAYVEVSPSERINLGYPPSWIAVHYLLNGEEGKHRKPFQLWVTDPANEKSAASLASALNMLMPTLDAALQEHLKMTW